MHHDYERLLRAAGGFGLYQGWVCLFYLFACMTLVPQYRFFVFAGHVPPLIECAANSTLNRYNETVCFEYSAVKSMAEDFRLVGDDVHYISLVNTAQIIGMVIGQFLCGYLTDRYGRRRVCLCVLTVMAAITVLGALVTNWQQAAAARLIAGMALSGSVSSMYPMAAEHLLPRWRLFGQSTIQYPIAFTYYGILAKFSPDWRFLSYVSTAANFACFLTLLGLSESPKWLFERGRTKEAWKIMERIARINSVWKKGAGFERNIEQLREADKGADDTLPKNKQRTFYYWNLCYDRRATLECLAFDFTYFSGAMAAYTLALNLSSLSGNTADNTMIEAAISAVTLIVIQLLDFKVERFTRKIMHCSSIILLGLCMLSLGLCHAFDVKATHPLVISVIAFFGSSVQEGLWAAIVLYGVELFPTQLRSMGFSVGGTSGRIGMIIGAQYASFYALWRPMIFIICFICCAINLVFAVLWLPETKNKPLRDLPEHMIAQNGENGTVTEPLTQKGSEKNVV